MSTTDHLLRHIQTNTILFNSHYEMILYQVLQKGFQSVPFISINQWCFKAIPVLLSNCL